MGPLRNFLRLPGSDRRLFVKATLLLEAISLGMWLFSFPTLRRLLARFSRASTGPQRAQALPVGKVVWAVETASRHLPGGKTCLTQALAAQTLLARDGHPATLRIGVLRGEEEQFQAHAWVESGGKAVIGGHELERYTHLLALEGREL
jgi:hypothetical protein